MIDRFVDKNDYDWIEVSISTFSTSNPKSVTYPIGYDSLKSTSVKFGNPSSDKLKLPTYTL